MQKRKDIEQTLIERTFIPNSSNANAGITIEDTVLFNEKNTIDETETIKSRIGRQTTEEDLLGALDRSNKGEIRFQEFQLSEVIDPIFLIQETNRILSESIPQKQELLEKLVLKNIHLREQINLLSIH